MKELPPEAASSPKCLSRGPSLPPSGGCELRQKDHLEAARGLLAGGLGEGTSALQGLMAGCHPIQTWLDPEASLAASGLLWLSFPICKKTGLSVCSLVRKSPCPWPNFPVSLRSETAPQSSGSSHGLPGRVRGGWGFPGNTGCCGGGLRPQLRLPPQQPLPLTKPSINSPDVCVWQIKQNERYTKEASPRATTSCGWW